MTIQIDTPAEWKLSSGYSLLAGTAFDEWLRPACRQVLSSYDHEDAEFDCRVVAGLNVLVESELPGSLARVKPKHR